MVRLQCRIHHLPDARRSPSSRESHSYQHHPLGRGGMRQHSLFVDHRRRTDVRRGHVQFAVCHERMSKRIGSNNSRMLHRRKLGQHRHRTCLGGALPVLLQAPRTMADRRCRGCHSRAHDQWDLGLVVGGFVCRADTYEGGVWNVGPRGMVLQLGTRKCGCDIVGVSGGGDFVCGWMGDVYDDSFLLAVALLWIFAFRLPGRGCRTRHWIHWRRDPQPP
mmetsp:Transcript_19552/g.40949  ORF Transcript_19552/g.40949 Transcript_19552/m.40949 type:complete len:219 (+) Transcript_19552:874-1530(+)